MNTLRITDNGKKILLKLVNKELARIAALKLGERTREDIDALIFLRSVKETLE